MFRVGQRVDAISIMPNGTLETGKEGALHRCTQCGTLMLVRHGDSGVSCNCIVRKPWEWIWTPEWKRSFHKIRRQLGIEKEELACRVQQKS